MDTLVQQESLQSLLLKMQFNGQTVSTGTGFIVESAVGPLLVTNRHNVTGRHQETGKLLSSSGAVPNEIVIVHNKSTDLHASNGLTRLDGWVERTERLLDADDKPLWKEHPTLGAHADFVALPLTQVDEVLLLPYDMHNLGPDITLGPTEVVSVIGFPFGKTAGKHFGIWATGFIASEPSVDYLDLPILLIDCRSRPGQSGSPVIAFRGDGIVGAAKGGMALFNGPVRRFVGIYSGRIANESDIGMVWKASAIRELVDSFNPHGWRYLASNWTGASVR